MQDTVTEYPETINVVQRFNIYPEVFLAVSYELYSRSYELMGWEGSNRECYQGMLLFSTVLDGRSLLALRLQCA